MAMVTENDNAHALLSRYHEPGILIGAQSGLPLGETATAEDYHRELVTGIPESDQPLSVYVHVPFCPVRCLNCESNTTITHDAADIERYMVSLEREMDLLVDRVGNGRRILQLHLGGGTPNYLTEPQLVRLMSILEHHFTIDGNTETSLNANPKMATRTQLDLLIGLGFKRIDYGIRDLDPGVQISIGRVHSTELIAEVFQASRDAGFESVNSDLIYGLPHQSIESMERTVAQMNTLAPDRISCFSYTRRSNLFPHQRAIESFGMPSLGDKLALFNVIVEGLTDKDYTWVGLDCFARHDDALCIAQVEHRLRRNWIGYTLQASADCFGFGTSAVSELNGLCVQNHFKILEWRTSLEAGSFPIRGGFRLSDGGRRYRQAVAELMCNMESRDSSALFDLDGQPTRLTDYARDGLVDVYPDKVSVTPQGRFLLHHIWNDMLPGHRWASAL